MLFNVAFGWLDQISVARVLYDTALFPGGKRQGSGVNLPPHLAPRLKKT